jgi:hypothetical protein
MIHQLIFAHPKPGMSEVAFQDYWLNVHAVRYASMIPQIRRYKVGTRIPCGPEPADPPFGGVAEIWLANEAEQLASLQSREYIEGARADEPNWAALGRTVALDTDATEILPGPPFERALREVKLIILAKRREGLPLAEFRRRAREVHAPRVLRLDGLRRYHQNVTRDSLYGFGEALLDIAFMLWFDGPDDLERIMASPAFADLVMADLGEFCEPRYLHTMAVREHWVIGPEFR